MRFIIGSTLKRNKTVFNHQETKNFSLEIIYKVNKVEKLLKKIKYIYYYWKKVNLILHLL